MANTKRYSSGSSYHFYNMGNRPLAYPVRSGNKTVIEAGSKYVKIAFGQSSLMYKDPITGKSKHMNVYLHKGKLYHAC